MFAVGKVWGENSSIPVRFLHPTHHHHHHHHPTHWSSPDGRILILFHTQTEHFRDRICHHPMGRSLRPVGPTRGPGRREWSPRTSVTPSSASNGCAVPPVGFICVSESPHEIQKRVLTQRFKRDICPFFNGKKDANFFPANGFMNHRTHAPNSLHFNTQ